MRPTTLLLLLACVLPAAAQEKDKTARLFERFDKNQDGALTKDELPERMHRAFARIDADGDGRLTPEEDRAFKKARANRKKGGNKPAPTHANMKYGTHERHVVDFWAAKGEGPRPLVVYYHGGGFRAGSKSSIPAALLTGLLARGIHVAAANYRLTNVAPYPAQMHDSARALQYLRSRAEELKIDSKRVGACGGSAGAGISQWLGFHRDLARPDDADPVARQSTRLTCVLAWSAQTTYDPREHLAMFATEKLHPALLPFFGIKGVADLKKPEKQLLFEQASPITHLSLDDPPVWLYFGQADQALPAGATGKQYIHHPKFGHLLKRKLDLLGIECTVKLRKHYTGGTSPIQDYVKFFAGKLLRD